MKWADLGGQVLVRLDAGDSYPTSLVQLACERNWSVATLSAIGGVKDVSLAYYDISKREYLPIDVEGIVELVNMTGNLCLSEGSHFWHCHAVVGDQNGKLTGGHLLSFNVALTVECWVTPFLGSVIRQFDPKTGLKLLQPT